MYIELDAWRYITPMMNKNKQVNKQTSNMAQTRDFLV